MDMGGGGGLAPVTFLGRGKFRQFWKIFNHPYKVYKIQHFRKRIYVLNIFVCS